MCRIILFVWLLGRMLASAGTLEFTDPEKIRVNAAGRLASLPAPLQQRVANNTLSWMTAASGRVLACWAQFGGENGVIAEPKPSPALLSRTRETCTASLAALSSDPGPAPRTADMVPAIVEFQHASRAVVESALRALETGVDEVARVRAVAQFNTYYRTLEAGRLPVWMLRAVAEPEMTPGFMRSI